MKAPEITINTGESVTVPVVKRKCNVVGKNMTLLHVNQKTLRFQVLHSVSVKSISSKRAMYQLNNSHLWKKTDENINFNFQVKERKQNDN